jgi:hypothetical protein
MQATCSTACSGVVPARQSGTSTRVTRATARPRCAPGVQLRRPLFRIEDANTAGNVGRDVDAGAHV